MHCTVCKYIRNARCIVLGDLNLDFLKWNDPISHQRLVELTKQEIETTGFSQIINTVTRSWPGQDDSIVDHCWTNDVERIVCHANSVRADSDHNLITVSTRMKDRVIMRQEIMIRKRKNMNLERIKSRSMELDWETFYRTTDVNKMAGILEENILSVLDSEVPLRKIQVRKNYCSWIDETLKDKISQRDEIREQARRTGDNDDWSRYRRVRNACTKDIRRSKKDFYEKKFEKLASENDSKNLHKEISDLLCKNRDLGPRTFIRDGTILRKPGELANHQLDFYENKMQKIMSSLRNMRGNFEDPVRTLEGALERWVHRPLIPRMKFKEISARETSRMVGKLSNSTASGFDNIDATFIKLLLPAIINPLTYLINTSLRTGVFASKWKISVVNPLLKDKDLNRMDPASYRPVCSLPHDF